MTTLTVAQREALELLALHGSIAMQDTDDIGIAFDTVISLRDAGLVEFVYPVAHGCPVRVQATTQGLFTARLRHDPARCGSYNVTHRIIRCPNCCRMIDTSTNSEV